MNNTNHVVCVGRRQNVRLLRLLRDQGYFFSGGGEIDPRYIVYTASYTDEEGASNQIAVYAIDETSKLVAYHNSISLLGLRQDEDHLMTFEEYVLGSITQTKLVPFQWKQTQFV